MLPTGTYEHHRSNKTITINGGGEIIYGGLDDESRIGSMNLSGVAIDEATETDEADYVMLRGRIRLDVDQLANQIYLATNPGPPTHYLAKRFGLDGSSRCANGCHAIQTCTADNGFLPDDYLEDLNTFTGLARKRYVLGQWCGSDGLIYDLFDRAVHVKDRRGPWTKCIGGVDWGFTHPTAVVVVCEDEQQRIHVIDEWVENKQLEPEIVAACLRLRRQYGIQEFHVDPSAAALRETMDRAELPVKSANNDVLAGISKVGKCFPVDGEGVPGITIAPRCRKLIDELGTYEWMPGKDKPKKELDDAVDALRYGLMGIVDDNGFTFSVISGEELAGGGKFNDERCWNTVYSQ